MGFPSHSQGRLTDPPTKHRHNRMKYKQDAKALERICRMVANSPQFKMTEDGTTFCNMAVRKILEGVGIDLFFSDELNRVMLANEMIDYMEASRSKFAKLEDGTDAASEASQGIIVIACEKGSSHGHVSVVCPIGMEQSWSWGKLVPMLANVGKKNGILRASQCFQEEPTYYCVLPF